MRHHVILNPTSGGGMGRKLRSEIERELTARGLHFTLAETERPWHAVELARAAAGAGADVVVAAGGDGTIHEVANGLLQARAERRVALGVIPVGTGNDFAKLLETGTDRAGAYDLLASGRVRDLDVGHVTWTGGAEYFINGMGTGVDVEVIRQVKRLPRMNGTLAYLIGLLRAVVGFKAVPLKVRADGRDLDRRGLLAFVARLVERRKRVAV